MRQGSHEVEYMDVLRRFLARRQEVDLLSAYELGKQYQSKNIGPEEIVGMHVAALEGLSPSLAPDERAEQVMSAFAVLIETMIAYGMAFSDATALLAETERRAEDAQFELERNLAELAVLNRQLADVDRLKNQFFANMNHELRTPLGSIIGFAEDALAGLAGELTPRLNRYLRHIHDSGRHLLYVINEILDLAKLQAGKVELEIVPFAVHQVLAEVADTVQPQFLRKNQTLHLEEARDLPPIRADRPKIFQALLNLVGNAHKYTPEGGNVWLSARIRGSTLEIDVRDDGVGIPESELSRIFEEFRQVSSLRKGSQQGTGLGLSIAKGLVELHDGAVTVESEVGRGSTFRILLPIGGPPGKSTLERARHP